MAANKKGAGRSDRFGLNQPKEAKAIVAICDQSITVVKRLRSDANTQETNAVSTNRPECPSPGKKKRVSEREAESTTPLIDDAPPPDEESVVSTRERPKVGVGVFVLSPRHPDCILLGKRKSPLGDGTYGLPGGHLEFGETWVECARRETAEETGLVLKDVELAAVLNVVVKGDNYHYLEFFLEGQVDTQHLAEPVNMEPVNMEPVNMEPDKCEGWEWVSWERFLTMDALFEPLKVIRRQGYNPFLQSTSQ